MTTFELVMIKHEFDKYANSNMRKKEQIATVDYGIKMHQLSLEIYHKHDII